MLIKGKSCISNSPSFIFAPFFYPLTCLTYFQLLICSASPRLLFKEIRKKQNVCFAHEIRSVQQRYSLD